MKGRPMAAATLTAAEQGKLELIAHRPKIDQRTVLRAPVVLGCAAGQTNRTVARKLGVCHTTAGKPSLRDD